VPTLKKVARVSRKVRSFQVYARQACPVRISDELSHAHSEPKHPAFSHHDIVEGFHVRVT